MKKPIIQFKHIEIKKFNNSIDDIIEYLNTAKKESIGYECIDIFCDIHLQYERIETDKEEQKREAREAKLKDDKVKRDLEKLNKLKEMYER